MCVCVGAKFQCDRTQSGRDREKPPHPIKGSLEKATSTGVSSSNAEPLWLPNGENGCHAWQASHHATTTNQIGGIKKREGQPHTDEQQAQKLQGNERKMPRTDAFPDTD